MSPYDLEDRTTRFSEKLIDFCKQQKLTITNQNVISQLLRAGTSIGANYFEANGAESKSDFKHKIGICKKEARETTYWLRLFTKTNIESSQEIKTLQKEVAELTLIFSKIFKSSSS